MPRDVKEDASWSCSVCGAGGSCVAGDESVALMIHMLVHDDEEAA